METTSDDYVATVQVPAVEDYLRLRRNATPASIGMAQWLKKEVVL